MQKNTFVNQMFPQITPKLLVFKRLRRTLHHVMQCIRFLNFLGATAGIICVPLYVLLLKNGQRLCS